MRRGAVAAAGSLSVLLSLALGTSAVALREEPPRAADVQAAAAGGRTVRAAERLEAFPAREPVADDGRGPAAAQGRPLDAAPADPPAPTGAPDVAATAPVAPASAPSSAPAAPTPDCSVLACIALTFDDGPGPDTGRLLDELAARGVSATFFVVGRQVALEPGIVAREAAAGHVVGNHTWDHALLPRLGAEAVGAELDSTSQAIVAEGAPPPTLARPPYGSTSPVVSQAYAARGLVGVLWDVDTEDWKNRDAAVTTQRALDGAHAGAVILMHDIRPSTVDAVPGLVDALRARGFTLVTVPQLLADAVPGRLYAHR